MTHIAAQSNARTPDVRWVLATLSLAMLLSSLGTSIANVGLPTLVEEFHASFASVQWVVLAYLLSITTLVVSVGRLGDLIGRRRLLLGGLFLFTVASVMCGSASALWQVIAARVLQGLGAAIMMALTLALVGEAVPKEKTGSAMGLLGTMSAIGTTLGSSLGGVLIAGFGWRSLFLINLPLGLLALLLAYHHLPVDRGESATKRIPFDHLGTVLLALTLVAYALAVTLGHGTLGLLNLALLFTAIIGSGLFAFVEAHAPSPLIRLATLRQPVLGSGFALSAIVATVVMTTLVIGPFYLAGAFALNPAQIGFVMSCGPLVSTLTGIPAGRLVDQFGAQHMTMAGISGMVIGSGIMPVMPAGLGVLGYIVPLVIITAGYALFQAANNTAVMTSIQPSQRGVISGMLTLSRNLGLITGASVMGAVFVFGAGINQAATRLDAVVTGMRLTFAVATILLVVALAIAVGSHVHSRCGICHHRD